MQPQMPFSVFTSSVLAKVGGLSWALFQYLFAFLLVLDLKEDFSVLDKQALPSHSPARNHQWLPVTLRRMSRYALQSPSWSVLYQILSNVPLISWHSSSHSPCCATCSTPFLSLSLYTNPFYLETPFPPLFLQTGQFLLPSRSSLLRYSPFPPVQCSTHPSRSPEYSSIIILFQEKLTTQLPAQSCPLPSIRERQ